MGDFEIWYQPLHHSQQNETDHLEFLSLCGILKPCCDVLDNIDFCNYCKKNHQNVADERLCEKCVRCVNNLAGKRRSDFNVIIYDEREIYIYSDENLKR